MAGSMQLRMGALAVLAVALSGCTAIREHRGYMTDTAIMQSVLPGIDNEQSVERSLGRPTFTSSYGQPVWYYISTETGQAAFTTPKARAQSVTRITFDKDGNVATVDERGLDKVVFLSPDGHKTPTLGRDRGFFEDLFGNIGAVGAVPSGGAGGGGGSGPNGS